MLVIYLQFTLSKKAKQCILTRSKFVQIVVYKILHFFYKLLILKYFYLVIFVYFSSLENVL